MVLKKTYFSLQKPSKCIEEFLFPAELDFQLKKSSNQKGPPLRIWCFGLGIVHRKRHASIVFEQNFHYFRRFRSCLELCRKFWRRSIVVRRVFVRIWCRSIAGRRLLGPGGTNLSSEILKIQWIRTQNLFRCRVESYEKSVAFYSVVRRFMSAASDTATI